MRPRTLDDPPRVALAGPHRARDRAPGRGRLVFGARDYAPSMLSQDLRRTAIPAVAVDRSHHGRPRSDAGRDWLGSVHDRQGRLENRQGRGAEARGEGRCRDCARLLSLGGRVGTMRDRDGGRESRACLGRRLKGKAGQDDPQVLRRAAVKECRDDLQSWAVLDRRRP
jgi:hypothetical protein